MRVLMRRLKSSRRIASCALAAALGTPRPAACAGAGRACGAPPTTGCCTPPASAQLGSSRDAAAPGGLATLSRFSVLRNSVDQRRSGPCTHHGGARNRALGRGQRLLGLDGGRVRFPARPGACARRRRRDEDYEDRARRERNHPAWRLPTGSVTCSAAAGLQRAKTDDCAVMLSTALPWRVLSLSTV